jgi:prevent-host-death family protein
MWPLEGDEMIYRIGIRELKNRLSYYIGQVRKGERITVTDRGQAVAVIVPTGETEAVEKLMDLTRDGFAAWEGGKPTGPATPCRCGANLSSEIVLEGRG